MADITNKRVIPKGSGTIPLVNFKHRFGNAGSDDVTPAELKMLLQIQPAHCPPLALVAWCAATTARWSASRSAGPIPRPRFCWRDAVGTVVEADRMPLIAAAFESGDIGLERDAGQQYSWQQTGVNIEAVPVRYDDSVVAVLTHQTAVADSPKSSPLETAYVDCAADLVHMLSEGTSRFWAASSWDYCQTASAAAA